MSSLLSVSAVRLTVSSTAPFKSTLSCSKFHIQASWKVAVPFNYSFPSRNLRNSTSRLGGFRFRDLIFDPIQDPLFKEVILKQYPEDEDEDKEDLEEEPETSEEALEILHKLLPKDKEGLKKKPEKAEALEMLPKFLPGKGLKMQEEKPKKPEEGLKTDEWELGIPEEELEMDEGGLGERDYRDRIANYSKQAKLPDVVQTGVGKIGDISVAIGVMDFKFMGGSMGSVVGEKITRLVEYATLKSLPLILVCASGGARMQEGSLSLMQMAKISSALFTYQSKNHLFIPILTTPTTGGVTASFAMLGDVIIAEPNALIAFAGKRVIEETLKLEVPEGSQSAEVLSEKGLLDLIIPREDLETVIYALFEFHQFHRKEPGAFLGGMFAGFLRLDLNEDPLKEWVARTVEVSAITEEENSGSEDDQAEEMPQQR